MLDHVKDNIVASPSNASIVARIKSFNGEVKAKKIIRDSIDKCLVAYVSKLTTFKEIYNRLVMLFKVNESNKVLFLIDKLKEINKATDESIQEYFLRITKIRKITITTLRGLPPEWYVFSSTLLNNNVIPGFEQLMARCIQKRQGWRIKKCPHLKAIPLPFLIMLKEEIFLGINPKERLELMVEEKIDVIITTKWATIQGSAMIKMTHTMMMTKITLKAIKVMVGPMA